jgi:PAS domain-containing protein
VTSELTIIDAHEEFEGYAGRPLAEVVGHNIFEVMPTAPVEPGCTPMWTPLEEAMTSGRREVTGLLSYDLEDPHDPGAFIEHWWAAVAQPLLGLAGEVEVIELSFRDVTPIISQSKARQAEDERSAG